MRPTNIARAQWAETALHAFANETGAMMPDEAVHDLIANIGHFCDRAGFDRLKVAAAGVAVWHAERADPDGLAPEPRVTITVTGSEDHNLR